MMHYTREGLKLLIAQADRLGKYDLMVEYETKLAELNNQEMGGL